MAMVLNDSDPMGVIRIPLTLVVPLAIFVLSISSSRAEGQVVQSTGGKVADAAKADDGDNASVALKLEGTDDNPVLIVTVTNIGRTTFAVDKCLTLGLTLIWHDKESSPVQPNTREIEPPRVTRNQWKERFAALAPGKSISRRIELLKGFRRYSIAVMAVPKTGHAVPAGFVEEQSQFAVEQWRRVARIEAILLAQRFMSPEFDGFTGLDSDSIHLFDTVPSPRTTLTR